MENFKHFPVGDTPGQFFKGKGREKGRDGREKEKGEENGDSSSTSFGLKVAMTNYSLCRNSSEVQCELCLAVE